VFYHRARYYDAVARRFISEDPIGLNGGINLYAYVGNSPQIWRDPQGLGPINPQQAMYYLYDFVDKNGVHQKYGFTNDLDTRYSVEELSGGRLIELIKSPDKGKVLGLERLLHKNIPPGPKEGQSCYRAIQKSNAAKVAAADKLRGRGIVVRGLIYLSIIHDLINLYDAQERAKKHGISPLQQMYFDTLGISDEELEYQLHKDISQNRRWQYIGNVIDGEKIDA
jgi:hypothetical protein